LEQVILEEKGAEATTANIRELRKLVKDEDAMATDLNHEFSRIRCDILAIQAYNQNVASTLKGVNDNVASKYNLISKFDAEIKQKDREVEIKTKEIIRLNRKYEQLTANFDDSGATSPAEAMVYSLKQEINQKMKESNESQKRWLSLQTSIVILQNEVNTLSEKVQRAAYDQGVLTQRKYRVDMQYNTLAKAIKDLNIGIRKKQKFIER
jgi:chromosome segregation ATPase